MIITNVTEMKLIASIDGDMLLQVKFDKTAEELAAVTADAPDTDLLMLYVMHSDYSWDTETYAYPQPDGKNGVGLSFESMIQLSEKTDLLYAQWVLTDDQYSILKEQEVKAGVWRIGMNEYGPSSMDECNLYTLTPQTKFLYDKKEFHFAKLQLLTSFCSTCLDKHQLEKIMLCCFKEQLFNTAMENGLWEDAKSIMTDLRRLLEMDEERTCCTKNHGRPCPTCKTCCQARSHCRTCCNGMCSL